MWTVKFSNSSRATVTEWEGSALGVLEGRLFVLHSKVCYQQSEDQGHTVSGSPKLIVLFSKVNGVMETRLPGNKELQYASLPPDKRTVPMKLLNTPWQDARFSNPAYTYNVMTCQQQSVGIVAAAEGLLYYKIQWTTVEGGKKKRGVGYLHNCKMENNSFKM